MRSMQDRDDHDHGDGDADVDDDDDAKWNHGPNEMMHKSITNPPLYCNDIIQPTKGWFGWD